MRLLFTLLVVVCAAPINAREVRVAEHGVVPGGDATYALNRLVESIREEAGVTLVFEPGEYDFYPENAVERYREVTNHDNGLKRIAFPLFGCRGVTVDGGGALFRFHGRVCPFVLDGVEGATLKKFTIDWGRSFHDELPVVESNADEKSFVVQVDPEKYPHVVERGRLYSIKHGWRDSMGLNILFDPKTRSPIYNTRQYNVAFRDAYKATDLGDGRVRLENCVRTVPPVGSVLISYGAHPTSRLCPAIHLANSKEITIRDVTIRDAGGMGVIAERSEDITLERVTVSSSDERLVSTRADATHFLGCRGVIRIEDCLFEHMLDDATNVHGAYVKVIERLSDKELLCEVSHFQQVGFVFCGPGDEVALLSRETVLPFFNTTVEGYMPINERRFVVTFAELPAELPDAPLSVENLTWYPDLVFRGNTVRENRARSVLVTTKGKVLIEDNYFSSQMNGILIEGDNKTWYESGAVGDVLIRNNTFVNSGFGLRDVYPLYASPMLTPEQRLGEGHYHRNIRFVDNQLKSFDGRVVFAKSIRGLTIRGNTVEFSTDYPPVDDRPAIDLHYCEDVTIEGNHVVGFDRELAVRSSSDTTGVELVGNRGLVAEE